MSLGNTSRTAICRSCHLDLQRFELQFVDLNFLSVNVAVPISNNVQVLKIVALVQDSNLIIGKVHKYLMLYAS